MENKSAITTDISANKAFPEATGTEFVHNGLDERDIKKALSGKDVLALMERTMGTPKPAEATTGGTGSALGMEF